MAITADHIRTAVNDYLDANPEEKTALAPIVALLDAGADLTDRTEFRGHATAGAILVGPDGRILHVHHLALDEWLLPGGHLEAEDATLLDAALRELTEETGIPAEAVMAISDEPVHIDVHPIPADGTKGEPGHRHVDFRFLFCTAAADLGRLQEDEVADAAWRDLDLVSDETLHHHLGNALR